MRFLRQLLPLTFALTVACGSSNDAGFSNSANSDASIGGKGGIGTGSGAGGKAMGSGTGGKGASAGGAGNGTGAGGAGNGTGAGGAGNGTGAGGAGNGAGAGAAGMSGGALGTGATVGAGGGLKDSGVTDVGDAKPTLDAAPPPPEAAVCAGTLCNVCTDLASDPLNCGACGAPVCHNEACKGTKVCAQGLVACGGAGACLGCKNLKSDPANCGSCGKACSAGEVCAGLKCTSAQSVACSAGLTLCAGGSGAPGACVNFATDITNCGACGKNCSPGEFCAAGSCTKYVTAPGCTACPCVACKAPTDKCCRYVDGNVCAAKCPAG